MNLKDCLALDFSDIQGVSRRKSHSGGLPDCIGFLPPLKHNQNAQPLIAVFQDIEGNNFWGLHVTNLWF